MKKLFFMLFAIMCICFTCVACAPIDQSFNNEGLGTGLVGPGSSIEEEFIENKELVALTHNEVVGFLGELDVWDEDYNSLKPIVDIIEALTNIDKAVQFDVSGFDYINGQEVAKAPQTVGFVSAKNELILNSIINSNKGNNVILQKTDDGFLVLNQMGDGIVKKLDKISYSDILVGEKASVDNLPFDDIKLVLTRLSSLSVSQITYDSSTKFHTISNDYFLNNVDGIVDYAFDNGGLSFITDSGLTKAQAKSSMRSLINEMGLVFQYKLSNYGNYVLNISLSPTNQCINNMLGDVNANMTVSVFDFELTIGNDLGTDVENFYLNIEGTTNGKAFSLEYDSDSTDVDGIVDKQCVSNITVGDFSYSSTITEQVDINQETTKSVRKDIEIAQTAISLVSEEVKTLSISNYECTINLDKQIPSYIFNSGEEYNFLNYQLQMAIESEENLSTGVANVSIDITTYNSLIEPDILSDNVYYYDTVLDIDFVGNMKDIRDNKNNASFTKFDIVKTIDYKTKDSNGLAVSDNGFFNDEKLVANLVVRNESDITSNYQASLSEDLVNIIASDDDNSCAYNYKNANKLLFQSKLLNKNCYVAVGNNKYIFSRVCVNESNQSFYCLEYGYAEDVESLSALGYVEYVPDLDDIIVDNGNGESPSDFPTQDFPSNWFDEIENDSYTVYFNDSLHPEKSYSVVVKKGEVATLTDLSCVCDDYHYNEQTAEIHQGHTFLGWYKGEQLITNENILAYNKDVYLEARWETNGEKIILEYIDFNTSWLD